MAMQPLPRTSPCQHVWRYLPLERLLTAIETHQLSLTLLGKYSKDDPYETSVPKLVEQDDCQIIYQSQVMCGFADDEDIEATHYEELGESDLVRHRRLIARRRALLRSAHASCWRSGDESEAMWRLYCPEKDKVTTGVAIRSTFQKLQDSIKDVSTVVSAIAYIDYKTDRFVRHREPYDPALHKRKAFEHEQEVRVLRFSPVDFERAGTDESHSAPERVTIAWNADAVIEKVVPNPRAAAGYLEAVTRAIESVSPSIAKLVQASDLAETPGW